ncbi:DUF2254 family protein [Egicoccus sp. AB-alg2]|uniref:DUF2254 family protein n=1 Tax=Egicoccus sp. AB-alg2 TaxID=3242693 RepID=UPI00359D6BB3
MAHDFSDNGGRMRAFAAELALRSAVGLVVGTAAGTAIWFGDRLLGLLVPLSPQTAQALLGAFVGGVLTIAVFALWMRTVVVGLASGQVSSRVLAAYLDDRFQRQIIGAMVAAFAYLVTATVLLPDEGDGVPLVTSVVSVAVVVAALIGVLLAMRNAVTSLSMPSVIRTLTDQVLNLLERDPRPNDAPPSQIPAPASEDAVIRSRSLGWVQDIDHEAVMEALPDGVTLVVEADVGEFIAIGERVAYVDRDVEPVVLDDLRAAFTLARTRSTDCDLAYAIQQLVDVAAHAMAPHSADTSTAHEALVHLRAVLHTLIRRGTASGCRHGERDQRIVSVAAWSVADHLDAVFGRLRLRSTADPAAGSALLRTFEGLEVTAREVGDETSVEVLHRHRSQVEPAAGGSPSPTFPAVSHATS